MRKPINFPRSRPRMTHGMVARFAGWSHVAYYGFAAMHGAGLYAFLAAVCVLAAILESLVKE